MLDTNKFDDAAKEYIAKLTRRVVEAVERQNGGAAPAMRAQSDNNNNNNNLAMTARSNGGATTVWRTFLQRWQGRDFAGMVQRAKESASLLGRASCHVWMRDLGISYGDAVDIMDELHRAGFVGDCPEDAGARGLIA